MNYSILPANRATRVSACLAKGRKRRKDYEAIWESRSSFGETIMDRLVFAIIIFAIPATVLATVFRWLSVEYALGIVWAVVLLIFALGISRVMREPTPDADTDA